MSTEVWVTGNKFYDVSRLPYDHLQGNQEGEAWLGEQSRGQDVIQGRVQNKMAVGRREQEKPYAL